MIGSESRISSSPGRRKVNRSRSSDDVVRAPKLLLSTSKPRMALNSSPSNEVMQSSSQKARLTQMTCNSGLSMCTLPSRLSFHGTFDVDWNNQNNTINKNNARETQRIFDYHVERRYKDNKDRNTDITNDNVTIMILADKEPTGTGRARTMSSTSCGASLKSLSPTSSDDQMNEQGKYKNKKAFQRKRKTKEQNRSVQVSSLTLKFVQVVLTPVKYHSWMVLVVLCFIYGTLLPMFTTPKYSVPEFFLKDNIKKKVLTTRAESKDAALSSLRFRQPPPKEASSTTNRTEVWSMEAMTTNTRKVHTTRTTTTYNNSQPQQHHMSLGEGKVKHSLIGSHLNATINNNDITFSRNKTNDYHIESQNISFSFSKPNTGNYSMYTHFYADDNNKPSNSSNISLVQRSQFAYVYVVGGCDPTSPVYRNFMYDILISTYNQRVDGSTADVVVMFQMLYKSKHEELPPEDVRVLTAMNIKILYIPKSKNESFYRIMLDKFRILDLIQYDRVMFLDSDVMTMGSMDYLFELSMAGILQENLVFAGRAEPANGGLFIVRPFPGAWDKILTIIQSKEERGRQLPYPHWDEKVGWGHVIDNATDYYQYINGTKCTKWDFHGAFADQGLLYHWVKYEQKSVSIIFKEHIENWNVDNHSVEREFSTGLATNNTGVIQLHQVIGIDVLNNKNFTYNRHCWKTVLIKKPCSRPHGDFVHFTSIKKPWLSGPPSGIKSYPISNPYSTPNHYWFHILSIINQTLNIGLDFKKWQAHQRPLLGRYPKFQHAANTNYTQTSVRLRPSSNANK